MGTDPRWVTARLTLVEVLNSLHRSLGGLDREGAAAEFSAEWARATCVELDASTCALAAEFAIETGARTLDALHLAAAWRAGETELDFLTFDARQARAARQLGFSVLGA